MRSVEECGQAGAGANTRGGPPLQTSLSVPASHRILVVDDDPSIRTLFRLMLEDAGYHPVVTGSARDALDASGTGAVDAVFLDLRIADEDGIVVLEGLWHNGIDVPIILMTAFPTVDTAAAAVRLAAFDYLVKPLSRDRVLSPQVQVKLLRVLQSKEIERVGDPTPR